MTATVLRPSSRFGLLYAIANVGIFICFIPLITLILPQRAIAIAPEASVRLLSWTLLAGGMASSIANIAAGWLSDRIVDRQGSRIPLIAFGFTLTMASLAILAGVSTEAGLITGFILFQFAFNTLFSPFNALAADHIPHADKGRVFGLLSLGLPLSQIVVVAMVWLRLDAPGSWLWTIILPVTLLLAPLLIFGRHMAGARFMPAIQSDVEQDPQPAALARQVRRDFTYAWFGRFFVQCAAVASGSFMLIHLSTVSVVVRGGASVDDLFGTITFISLAAGLSVGLLVGLWSDHEGRRRPFLFVASLLVAVGFATMGGAYSWAVLVTGYSLFAIGFAGFLTIDGAIIAEIVTSQRYRASRLGIINLSNTLPAMVVPAVSLTIDQLGASPTPTLFICIAAGALMSAWLTSKIRSIA